jgi:hypothetical protein
VPMQPCFRPPTLNTSLHALASHLASMAQRSRAQAMLSEPASSEDRDDGQLVVPAGGGFVVAVIENRAKEARAQLKAAAVCLGARAHQPQTTHVHCMQVGLAALELESMTLSLLQYVEASRGYSNTQ